MAHEAAAGDRKPFGTGNYETSALELLKEEGLSGTEAISYGMTGDRIRLLKDQAAKFIAFGLIENILLKPGRGQSELVEVLEQYKKGIVICRIPAERLDAIVNSGGEEEYVDVKGVVCSKVDLAAGLSE